MFFFFSKYFITLTSFPSQILVNTFVICLYWLKCLSSFFFFHFLETQIQFSLPFMFFNTRFTEEYRKQHSIKPREKKRRHRTNKEANMRRIPNKGQVTRKKLNTEMEYVWIK